MIFGGTVRGGWGGDAGIATTPDRPRARRPAADVAALAHAGAVAPWQETAQREVDERLCGGDLDEAGEAADGGGGGGGVVGFEDGDGGACGWGMGRSVR